MIWIVFIVFVIAIILISNVYLFVTCKDGLCLRVRFLFFSFEPTKEKKTPKKSNKTKKNRRFSMSQLKKPGLHDFIDLIKEIIRIATSHGRMFIKKIHIKKLNLNINIIEEDAAKAAISYGKVCTVVYPFLSLMGITPNENNTCVNISPCYTNIGNDEVNPPNNVELDLVCSVRLIYIIGFFISSVVSYTKNKINKK